MKECNSSHALHGNLYISSKLSIDANSKTDVFTKLDMIKLLLITSTSVSVVVTVILIYVFLLSCRLYRKQPYLLISYKGIVIMTAGL